MTEIEVTDKDIKRYSKLSGVVKALNRLHGADKWGEAEVRAYIVQAKAKKLMEAERPPSLPVAQIIPPETFQKRLDEYLSAYDRITPNDRQSFATMVTLELNMERVREKLTLDLEPSDRQKLTESMTTMSREHRQLQDALGIGRAKRKSEASAQDEIEKLRAGASRFLASHTVKIDCRACRTTVNLGFIAFHFKDLVPWRFEALCPKCSERIRWEGPLELPPAPPPQVFNLA